MKTLTWRRLAGVFFRTFVVVLAFTIDVRVKADTLVESVKGSVEVEKGGSLVKIVDKTKLEEPFEIQTFARALTKLEVNSIYLGIGEKSLMSIPDAPSMNLSWGNVFVSAPTRDQIWFSIETPQVEIKTAGAEFIAVVRDGKTTVHVISGKIEMTDRGSGNIQALRPGYQDWVGGLTVNGSHARGRPEAIDFGWVMAELHEYGNFTLPEFQNRYDRLRPLAADAVNDVAQQTHDQILGDLQIYDDVEKNEEKREARHRREHALLKKEFYQKSLGDPSGTITLPRKWAGESGGNKEVPWQSPRAPASPGE